MDGESDYSFTGITEFDIGALRKALEPLVRIPSVTQSTPLGPSVGSEEGYVKGSAVRLYKRGTGDLFHPPLYPVNPGGQFDNIIHTSPVRYLHLTRDPEYVCVS